MAPALVVLAVGADPTHALVLSQVVLSFGIPFALVPLVMFTSRRDLMGALVNRSAAPPSSHAAVPSLIIGLNVFLLAPHVRALARQAATVRRHCPDADRSRMAARRRPVLAVCWVVTFFVSPWYDRDATPT